MKITALSPTVGQVPALFAFDMAHLLMESVAAWPPEMEAQIGWGLKESTYLHTSREELMRHALQEGSDYILWVDSDMRFPRDALLRLLAHGEPVVGINYASRSVPTDYVAIKKVPDSPDEKGQKCVTLPTSEGLEPVDAMGFGMVLLEASALRRLPKDEPWFWFERRWPGDHVGEDVWFFRLLRQHGLQPMVDHDLSKDCGHIGNFTYGVEHAALEKGLIE